MPSPTPSRIAAPVRFAARRPIAVLLIALLLAALCLDLAANHLGVTTDVDKLFSAALPWKRQQAEMRQLFPQFNDLIVAVVDAQAPEEAEATAASLEAALRTDPAHFNSVRRPDDSPFFDRNGLLFLDKDALGKLLDQTVDAQPFLGQLAADPSARGLFAALGLVAMGVEREGADLGPFAPALNGFNATLQSVLDGHPKPLSWQQLLAGPVAELGGPYRFVLIQPKLDYSALAPGGAATDALRAAAAKLPFVQSGQARIRVTGSVPLADEEFSSVAQGAVQGLIGSFILVCVWLTFAVRSWRLILPIVVTLILGLLFTTGFATVTVGTLNLISVAFAILFVGIAVDFAIQFSVRYRDVAATNPGADAPTALTETARRAGIQILVAAAATSAGFLAFVPTAFSGVAELGQIAGAGMLIAFACTVTILPAAITLLRRRRRPASAPALAAAVTDAGFAWAAPLDRAVVRARLPILAAFALIAVAGILAAPHLTFDSDPLHTKNPDTEAMHTLADLAANPVTDPYTIDILAPDKQAADATIARVEKLPLVGQVLSLGSFVPSDQQAKLALIADAASLLSPSLAPRSAGAPVTAPDLRLAAQAAGAQLAHAVTLPGGQALAPIAHSLAQLQNAPDATLLAANAALTAFLPEQLSRLRDALSAGPVTEASIPPEIARDWILPDGRRRIELSGKPEAAGSAGLHRFVAEVQAAIPDAGGSAAYIVETANTIISAFTHAAVGAILAILVILAVALRRATDVLMVLIPLIMSALTTVLVIVLLPMPLNFANIIALPLLLGVGVSFNIYFVMNWRAGLRQPLQSPTARAVVFSALTTGTAFGSLALSAHPGTASMGRLLLLSLACTLLASLVLVPALLATIPTSRAATKAGAQV